MEGGLSLSDFIAGVKKELIQASKNGANEPFFELTEVELEANFVLGLSATAKGGLDFFVKLEGTTSGTQTHRVKIKLKPIERKPTGIVLSSNRKNINIEKIIDRPIMSPLCMAKPEMRKCKDRKKTTIAMKSNKASLKGRSTTTKP